MRWITLITPASVSRSAIMGYTKHQQMKVHVVKDAPKEMWVLMAITKFIVGGLKASIQG